MTKTRESVSFLYVIDDCQCYSCCWWEKKIHQLPFSWYKCY